MYFSLTQSSGNWNYTRLFLIMYKEKINYQIWVNYFYEVRKRYKILLWICGLQLLANSLDVIWRIRILCYVIYLSSSCVNYSGKWVKQYKRSWLCPSLYFLVHYLFLYVMSFHSFSTKQILILLFNTFDLALGLYWINIMLKLNIWKAHSSTYVYKFSFTSIKSNLR